MKKTIFVLNVDNYSKEITDITYPFIKKYAEKIGADFYEITERKFPDMPPVYEKMQIYELAKQMGNDWNIYIDSDAFIHPDTPDVTTMIDKDTVMQFANDYSPVRFRPSDYTIRDGRWIGACNWFTVASNLCVDLWKPLEISFDEAVKNIFPTGTEIRSGITAAHLIDDYTLTQNIARYGLKYKTFKKIIEKFDEGGRFFWHEYLLDTKSKIIELKRLSGN